MPKPGTALLYSGGLDSWCAWHLLGRPAAYYVQLAHRYERRELQAMIDLRNYVPADAPTPLRLYGPPLGILEESDGHIPHRNLQLALTLAANAPHVHTIYVIATAGESSPDKSARFLHAASTALAASEHRRLRLVAPYRKLTKAQLLGRYLDRYRGAERMIYALGYTASCYAGGEGLPCWECLACFRRWVAQRANQMLPETAPPEPFAQQTRERDLGVALRYLRRTPLSEWPGMARLNHEARREVLRWDRQ